MIVRSIDGTGDWTFGKGKNNYLSGNDAIMQNVATRLRMFLGDCFFAPADGLDWFNLLGSKNRTLLELSIRTVILNTRGVSALISLAISFDEITRLITFTYTVSTVFTETNGTIPITTNTKFLLTEAGDVLTTESGDNLSLG